MVTKPTKPYCKMIRVQDEKKQKSPVITGLSADKFQGLIKRYKRFLCINISRNHVNMIRITRKDHHIIEVEIHKSLDI